MEIAILTWVGGWLLVLCGLIACAVAGFYALRLIIWLGWNLIAGWCSVCGGGIGEIGERTCSYCQRSSMYNDDWKPGASINGQSYGSKFNFMGPG